MTSLQPRPPAPTTRDHHEFPPGFRGTTAGKAAKPTSTYTALLAKVRDAGLLKRRTGFYVTTFTVVSVLLAAAATGWDC
ncbi:hypothetical protein GCM10022256_22620 [Frondihabitans peucedani]|uniref:Uncharacterized protein n=1 Tax=Frondihabitans peucedani TaxID=598626 RepID=A0ABP8E3N9_9MICO